MAGGNPFDVLGISPNAEPEVIRAAYRALGKKYHPDTSGETKEQSTRRMAELNWAWEELRRDLSGWRAKIGGGLRDSPGGDGSSDQPERDEGHWWREHTKKYRLDKGQSLGWRAWLGSDVVCANCGCTLEKWVYKCPDCMQTGTWKRSRLHAIGHKLRVVYWVILFGTAYSIAVPFLLGLLSVPVILALDTAGLLEDDRGWPWEWRWWAVFLLIIGISIEVALWVGWVNRERLKEAIVRYWRG